MTIINSTQAARVGRGLMVAHLLANLFRELGNRAEWSRDCQYQAKQVSFSLESLMHHAPCLNLMLSRSDKAFLLTGN